MTTLTLQRLEQTDLATFGHIVDAEHQQWCVTLELPWVDANDDGLSDRNVSCVPAGTYAAHRRLSHLHGGTGRHNYDVFELADVPGRSAIELHVGNLPHDSRGCILLGSQFGLVNGQHGITGSAAAFGRFMDRLKGIDTFTLVIRNPS